VDDKPLEMPTNLDPKKKRYQQVPEDTIWHYCSLPAFQGIVENRMLWGSRLSHMNDATELNLGLKRFRQGLQSSLQHEITTIGPQVQQRIEKVIHDLRFRTESPVAAVCFSKRPNHLSQWRGYCSPGLGYCIGFDPIRLARYQSHITRPFNIVECYYKKSEHLRHLDPVVQEVASYIRADIADGVDPQPSRWSRWWMGEQINFQVLVSAIKHKCFRGEREVRFVKARHHRGDYFGAPKMRSGQTMLVPYWELKFDYTADRERVALAQQQVTKARDEGRDAAAESAELQRLGQLFDAKRRECDKIIRSVIVGPTPHKRAAVRAANDLLQQNGFADCAEYCDLPYRPAV
jgi:hypothetical protein